MARTICLIDDTPDLLRNFTEFLEMEGFNVWPCNGGSEALKRMENEEPDLIITDLWMPGMDGMAIIEHTRKDKRLDKIPVIIFSARPVQDYEEMARKLGVGHYIKKPATLEEILQVVNSFFIN